MFYCMVAGTRTFTNAPTFYAIMDKLLANHTDITIVAGGAHGADELAKQYAKTKGYAYKEFPADWDLYGKRAGFVRNEAMHKYIAQFEKRGVVLFWDGQSRGTAHSFSLAKTYNNPLRCYNYITQSYIHN